jgi:hypothetical protein
MMQLFKVPKNIGELESQFDNDAVEWRSDTLFCAQALIFIAKQLNEYQIKTEPCDTSDAL